MLFISYVNDFFIKKIKTHLAKRSSLPFLFLWLLVSIFCILVYHFYPIFILNENQILYIFSSASQVLAAIYGLIITGYIFLRNELDRKADKDDTYEEIILLLKTDYFRSIKSISITTFISISLCFLVLADENHESFIVLAYLINLTISAIIITLLKIILFVIDILNPNSLEIASDKLKEIASDKLQENVNEYTKFKKSTHKINNNGSLEVFLKTFNSIDYILVKYGTTLMFTDIENYQVAMNKKIAKNKLVDVLYKGGKISLYLRNNLIKLISFRNGLVHGSDLSLAKEDVEFAQATLNDLQNQLHIA